MYGMLLSVLKYTYVSRNHTAIMNYFSNNIKVKWNFVSVTFRCIKHHKVMVPEIHIIYIRYSRYGIYTEMPIKVTYLGGAE